MITVISPHCDDAILSIGGLIGRWARRDDVQVITVFAGDKNTGYRAGPWDERSGFNTMGAAAEARQAEDRLACRHLGATTIHLPYFDEQYGIPRDADTISRNLAHALEGSKEVYMPGWPLANSDHLWASLLTLKALDGLEGVDAYLYAEEPYKTWRRSAAPLSSPLVRSAIWMVVPMERFEALRKAEAIHKYVTQLPLLAAEVTDQELGGQTLVMSLTNTAMQAGECIARADRRSWL